MPSFATAAAVLLARHVLSQMDVPTRQAYTMALVAPEERPAAAGIHRQRPRPRPGLRPRRVRADHGRGRDARALPAGRAGSKIVYDLSLYLRFRSVPDGRAADLGDGSELPGEGRCTRRPSLYARPP